MKPKIKNDIKRITWLYKTYRLFRYLPNHLRKFLEIDTYFVSPPKAGRTWLMTLLSKLLASHYKEPFEMDLITKGLKECPRIRFTHDMLDPSMRFLPLKFRRTKYWNKDVIFMARDPRDMIVSYYFQITKREEEHDFEGSISEFIRSSEYGINRFVDFMNMWIENRDKPKSFHLFRYEDMKQQAVEEVLDLLDFLDLKSISQEKVSEAVEFAKFENMKKMEKNEKFEDRQFLKPGDKKDKESYKVRKGKVGGFEEYLSEEDLDYVNSATTSLKEEFGYL